jgi:DNA-binding protein H-NS
MATLPDISKLSYTELKKLLEDAQTVVDSKRDEELKVLADGYAKKIAAAGFGIGEAIEALLPYMPKTRTRAPRGSTPASPKRAYVMGTVYGNPSGPETWTGGTKGQMPKWLKPLVTDLEGQELVDKFASLTKK